MMRFLLYIGLIFSYTGVWGQLSNPVKEIIDNPDSPDLALLILEANKLQAQQKAAFDYKQIKQRNLFSVQELSGNFIVRMEPISVDEIEPYFLEFLQNPEGSPRLSDSLDGSTPYTGEFYVSEGVAVVQYEPGATAKIVPAVRELAQGLNRYRNRISLKAFKVPYEMCPDLGKSVIDQFMSSKLIFIAGAMSKPDATPPSPPGEGLPKMEEEEEDPLEPELEGQSDSDLPASPSLKDLEKAADKLKDILLGGESGSESKTEQDLPGLGDISRDFNIDLVDRAPSLKSCNSAPNDEESKYCFKRAVQRYVQEAFEYPSALRAQEHPPHGKIYLQFLIDAQGQIEGSEVVRGLDPQLDALARESIRGLPVNGPATIAGKAVRMYHTVVIEAEP